MWKRTWNLLDHAFFGPHSEADRIGSRAVRLLRYPYAILRDLIGGELNLRATGLVYATLLALIPALALSFAVTHEMIVALIVLGGAGLLVAEFWLTGATASLRARGA